MKLMSSSIRVTELSLIGSQRDVRVEHLYWEKLTQPSALLAALLHAQPNAMIDLFNLKVNACL